MQKLPCPRFELRWEQIDELAVEDEFAKELEMRGLPIPRWNWQCVYSLILPLAEFDIRRESHDDEMRVQINVTKCQRGDTIAKPIDADGEVETPFRDGMHAKWDSDAIGGNVPVVAICGDVFTVIKKSEE